jgi:predicted XRE-type DNA-binding protein
MNSFWKKAKIKGPEDCWEWDAAIIRGYGAFRFLRIMSYAHRVSWTLTYGEIPKGLQVLHKCDNQLCINPKHLFLGTHIDNMKDMNSKGRGRWDSAPCGENSKNHKLTTDQVLEIRNLFEKKQLTQKRISELFKVSTSTISLIVNKKYWKHLLFYLLFKGGVIS